MVRQTTRPGTARARRQAAAGTSQLANLARSHAQTALGALVDIAAGGGSEAARISAANAILDRAYGKPPAAAPDVTTPGASKALRDLSDDELLHIASDGGARVAAPQEGA